jgi:hypothetical protein
MTATLSTTPTPAGATTLHVDCDAGESLQSAIGSAAANSTISVTGTCFGNFTLDQPLMIQGDPTATLDGDDAGIVVRILATPAPGVRLSHLLVTNGWACQGGGVNVSDNGSVTLDHVTVKGNVADGTCATPGGQALGGGIRGGEGADLTLIDSALVDNIAHATGNGSFAYGGGMKAEGPLTLIRTLVRGNRAVAVSSGGASEARGGGIYLNGFEAVLRSSSIEGNRAFAGPGTATALGGGIATENDMTLNRSTIVDNVASASGTTATARGGGFGQGSNANTTLISSHVDANTAVASGVAFASASGGGVYQLAKPLSLSKDTVDGNLARAGSAQGASATGGGVEAGGAMSATASTVSRNAVQSSAHTGQIAEGFGGGLDLGGADASTIQNSTVASNSIHADSFQGSVDAGGGGILAGGGSLLVKASTVARNTAGGAAANVGVDGGGIRQQGGPVTLTDTILALNTAPPPGDGPNCAGSVASGGHDLLGSLSGCTFAGKPSDQLNVSSPGLKALASNGGSTQTIALLKTSPAVDDIPAAACPFTVDQRGVLRPQPRNGRCDVGAYELKV